MEASKFDDDNAPDGHAHSFKNYDEIKRSKLSGCFKCLAMFPANEVVDWVEEDNKADGSKQQSTGLCPDCSTDAVIGDASGLPITHWYLYKMQDFWFGSY